MRDHRPCGAPALARQPHQAVGRLRHGRRAAGHLQRRSALCRVRRRLHHDCRRRHRAHLGRFPIEACSLLGLDSSLRVQGFHRAHERYLRSHRAKILRMSTESVSCICEHSDGRSAFRIETLYTKFPNGLARLQRLLCKLRCTWPYFVYGSDCVDPIHSQSCEVSMKLVEPVVTVSSNVTCDSS